MSLSAPKVGLINKGPAWIGVSPRPAGNAVLAAIAASDAICCLRLGRFHSGDHRAAARLLGLVRPDGPELAKQLARVLAVKDQVDYSGDPIPESRMVSVLRSTARLVETAERTLGETR